MVVVVRTEPFSTTTSANVSQNSQPNNYVDVFEDNKQKSKKDVIGFLPSWSVAQHVTVRSEYLDQLIYFSIPINSSGQLGKVSEDGSYTLNWHYFISEEMRTIIEESKSDTKILVTISNFENESIDKLVSNPSARKTAIRSLSNLISEYSLDGINFNFEYVTNTDFSTRRNLNTFLSEVSAELRNEFPNILLSFDVNATAVYADSAYDMVKIGETMDQVIIMGYDFKLPRSSYSGPVSPLFSDGALPSIDTSILSLKGIVSEEKIILGVPLYGYEWQTYYNSFGSPTVPQSGALATYKRIRTLIKEQDVELFFDQSSKTPWLRYIQNGVYKQIYYENEVSLAEKIEYVYEHNLQGIALWALGYDGDFIDPWKQIDAKLNEVE